MGSYSVSSSWCLESTRRGNTCELGLMRSRASEGPQASLPPRAVPRNHAMHTNNPEETFSHTYKASYKPCEVSAINFKVPPQELVRDKVETRWNSPPSPPLEKPCFPCSPRCGPSGQDSSSGCRANSHPSLEVSVCGTIAPVTLDMQHEPSTPHISLAPRCHPPAPQRVPDHNSHLLANLQPHFWSFIHSMNINVFRAALRP